MNDVIALGELLIDFTPHGVSDQGNATLEVNPGGAPCNVLSILNRLGCSTEFIGKVGNDGFGKLLNKTLIEEGIGEKGLILSDEYNTTGAFVHLDESGDRSFSFYRNIGADIMLEEDEIDEALIKNSKVFHFGTLSLTHNPSKSATKKAIKIAKDNNLLISFDPNYRPGLWKSENEAKDAIVYGLQECDIVKISDNELEFVTGTNNIDEGIKIIKEKFDIKLILVTLGEKGSAYSYKECINYRDGFKSNVVDTTGAGDAFWSGFYTGITKSYTLKESLNLGFATSAYKLKHVGAITDLPKIEEIKNIYNI